MCITSSVGRAGQNIKADVKTVQILLNMNIGAISPIKELDEDGAFGNATLIAIEEFQRFIGVAHPDGRVDPGGKTLMKMREGIPGFCRRVLQGIFINAGKVLAAIYADALKVKMVEYGIETPLRIAHFLAQVGHESGELRYSEEIASGAAYENRADLGNTEPGDGRRFKGRGLIQLTGRSNYLSYSKYREINYTTDEGAKSLAADPETAADAACWFWTQRGLNYLADRDEIETITKRINGGLNGLEDRKNILVRAKFFLCK